MQEAAATLSALSTASSDPQTAVDAWTALVDAYTSAAASITNADVKSAVAAVAEHTGAVRDILSKVYVDGDTGAAAEITAITQDWQASFTELNTLCMG